jgi:hypothetical protein
MSQSYAHIWNEHTRTLASIDITDVQNDVLRLEDALSDLTAAADSAHTRGYLCREREDIERMISAFLTKMGWAP